MIVCLCRGVSDRQVIASIGRGAATLGDLMRDCGAGDSCGSCCDQMKEILVRRGASAEELHTETPAGQRDA